MFKKKYGKFFWLLIFVSNFMYSNKSFAANVQLNASFNIVSDWGTGYQVNVNLTNPSSSATTSWSGQFNLESSKENVSSFWSANFTINGALVQFTNVSWNGVIPPGGSTTFGFVVSNAQSMTRTLPNLQATGAIGQSTVPVSPVLNGITVNPATPNNYTVSWNAVANATSYILQQSTNSGFTSPTTVAQGNVLSQSFVNQPNGTYYYRVFASNSSGNSPFSNVQSVTINAQTPVSPVLNGITVNPATPSNYTVSWNAVANATSYTLQQSTNSSFTSPTTVAQGNVLSQSFVNQPNGTYYYRVFASDSSGNSPFSNVQSVTINVPIPPSSAFVEGYWESWSSDPIESIINMKVDIIDVAFATFARVSGSTFNVIGLDASQATLTQFITAAHAAGKKVKISVGGATYPLSTLLQSTQDAMGLAQAITQFVQSNSLDGVDYDIEDYPAANLQIALLQYTRQLLGNNAIISYTAKTPASTTAPYTQVIQGGYQYFSYVSIMAYDAYPQYNYQQDVQALIAMGVPAAKIVVGFMPGYDDTGVLTTLAQISSACQYILQNNLSGIMFWALNRDYENLTGLGVDAATNTAWSIIH